MYEHLLANFALHIALDADEQMRVLDRIEHKTVKKNSLLLRAGDVCRNIYFVNQGCLRLFHTDETGEEHNLMFCPESWWAADIASFSRQNAAFYAIGALEDTDVFYLGFTALEQLYIEVPKLERFFRILGQNGFNLYQRRLTSSHSQTAEERYARFQKLYPGLEQRITQKQIASYLGITAVFLSMIRKR